MTPGKHRAYREILAMISKKNSDSQKITIPFTPTAAASTLQYFHLHRGFKACNDVNYVKKRTLVMNMIHIYLIEVNLAPLM